MKKTLPLFLLTAMLSAPVPGFTGECKGISFPEQIQVDGARLQLNGLGLRQATLLRINVYVAALYLESKSANAGEILQSTKPKRLVLHFLRGVGRDDITKAWSEGFEANAGAALPGLKDRITTLNGWMADVGKDEVMSFTYKPGTGVQIDLGGVTKGTIKGDDFARALFSIWLGANPPNAGLKTGLLGGECG
ncbi:MAG: chalcone isomerase family protein [Candidatus Competibacteraceae bacterium]